MNKKTIMLILFAGLVFLQISVPAKMIWSTEKVLKEGTTFKFKCRPVDPTDLFRGKYITLNFADDEFYDYQFESNYKDDVYVIPEVGSDGFAKIKNVFPKPPDGENIYFKAKVGSTRNINGNDYIRVNFPFKRYYMEESKAKPAEDLYRDAIRSSDSTMISPYALVTIQNGKAVLKNVMIDDQTIEEILEEKMNTSVDEVKKEIN